MKDVGDMTPGYPKKKTQQVGRLRLLSGAWLQLLSGWSPEPTVRLESQPSDYSSEPTVRLDSQPSSCSYEPTVRLESQPSGCSSEPTAGCSSEPTVGWRANRPAGEPTVRLQLLAGCLKLYRHIGHA